MSKVVTKALKLHPSAPFLWTYAAAWRVHALSPRKSTRDADSMLHRVLAQGCRQGVCAHAANVTTIASSCSRARLPSASS